MESKLPSVTAQKVAANVAEARRVLEAAAAHQLSLEFTADGWRMVPVDLDAVLAVAPYADELRAVAS